jgi:hypothetical protein
VTSVAQNPDNPDEMYLTTEYEGLWHSDNCRATAPQFSRVDSYPFKQPERVFFNPYNKNEIWVSSFGNGMRVGNANGNAVKFGKKNNDRAHIPNVRFISGKLIVTGETGDKNATLKVVSVSGRVMFEHAISRENSNNTLSIGLGWLSAGIYFVKIGNGFCKAIPITVK